jgi:hypothetical protein
MFFYSFSHVYLFFCCQNLFLEELLISCVLGWAAIVLFTPQNYLALNAMTSTLTFVNDQLVQKFICGLRHPRPTLLEVTPCSLVIKRAFGGSLCFLLVPCNPKHMGYCQWTEDRTFQTGCSLQMFTSLTYERKTRRKVPRWERAGHGGCAVCVTYLSCETDRRMHAWWCRGRKEDTRKSKAALESKRPKSNVWVTFLTFLLRAGECSQPWTSAVLTDATASVV